MITQVFKSICFLLCLLTVSSLIAQQDVAIVAVHSKLSFDVDHASHDDEAAIRQQENLKNDNQLWEMIEVTKGLYRFKAKHSGKFLTAPTNGGAWLTQMRDTPGPEQQFNVVELGSDEYYLRHAGTGRYVGVNNNSKATGQRIVLLEEGTDKPHKFRLEGRYPQGQVHYGRPAAPVTYSFSVKNTSMWDVSFRVAFGSEWSEWKYARVSVNPKSVSISSERRIEDYEIRWKDLTVWKNFSGGRPMIPDASSMHLKVSGNTLTGIKLN